MIQTSYHRFGWLVIIQDYLRNITRNSPIPWGSYDDRKLVYRDIALLNVTASVFYTR